jgi:hypothetical protein
MSVRKELDQCTLEYVYDVLSMVSPESASGPDLQLWEPQGNQNMEAPISNSKFRL